MSEISVPFKNKPRVAIALTAGFSLLLLLLPKDVKYSFSTAISKTIYTPFFSLGNAFSELLTVKKANEELRQRLLRTNLENQALKEAALENHRLKELLNLPAPAGFAPVAARLIGLESAPRPSEITVNRGAKDGIRRNLPVVQLKGLVGKVVDATPDAAVIQLLFDPGCRVAVRDQRSRILGIVKWKSGPFLSVDNVALTDDVAPGDTIISSGLGGVFPEGLLVGTVKSVAVDSSSVFRRIDLLPAASFSALEDVFVLVPANEGRKNRP